VAPATTCQRSSRTGRPTRPCVSFSRQLAQGHTYTQLCTWLSYTYAALHVADASQQQSPPRQHMNSWICFKQLTQD
jgi:hypothetical protein